MFSSLKLSLSDFGSVPAGEVHVLSLKTSASLWCFRSSPSSRSDLPTASVRLSLPERDSADEAEALVLQSGAQTSSQRNPVPGFCSFQTELFFQEGPARNKHAATIRDRLLKSAGHFLLLLLSYKSNVLSNEISVFEM